MARWTRRPCSTPGLGQDVDGVDLPTRLKRRLGGGKVEGGDGGAGQVVGRAEADDAGEGEGLGGPGEQDPHPVTHFEVVLAAPCPASMTTSAGSSARVPLRSVQRRHLGDGVEGHSRSSVPRSCSPPCRRGRRTGRSRSRHPSASATPGTGGRSEPTDSGIGTAHGAAAGPGERRLAPDLEVDVLVDAVEEGGEGVVQRVGEHQGAR